MEATSTERHWITTPNKLRLGDTIHIETSKSRRKAKVIAVKPGQALIEYKP